MTVHAVTAESTPASIQALAVSFSYPPETEPRAIQVSRLLKHLKVSTVLVCGSKASRSRNNQNGLGDVESFLKSTLRVPLEIGSVRETVNRVARRVYIPVYARTPDPLRPWRKPALEAIETFMVNGYRPDVLMTFAYPLVDSLIGLELKRRHGFPWLAHFSDPWTDSPFRTDDRITKALNLRLERKVIEEADRIVFTSEETADLVMAKYQTYLRDKIRICPHAYEPDLFPVRGSENYEDRLVIRFLGDLYLHRTPKPLFDALRTLAKAKPELLAGFRFEIVGSAHDLAPQDTDLSGLPGGLVVFSGRVGYLQSLDLMSSSAGLLVIDAPAEQNTKSVFLPSKLIEYIGAGRPVLALTPSGAAADLVNRLGGWVADPANETLTVKEIESFLLYLRENKTNHSGIWGAPAVRSQYEAVEVARKFQEIIEELI